MLNGTLAQAVAVSDAAMELIERPPVLLDHALGKVDRAPRKPADGSTIPEP